MKLHGGNLRVEEGSGGRGVQFVVLLPAKASRQYSTRTLLAPVGIPGPMPGSGLLLGRRARVSPDGNSTADDHVNVSIHQSSSMHDEGSRRPVGGEFKEGSGSSAGSSGMSPGAGREELEVESSGGSLKVAPSVAEEAVTAPAGEHAEMRSIMEKEVYRILVVDDSKLNRKVHYNTSTLLYTTVND